LIQNEKAEEYIRLFFEIVRIVNSDDKLVTYALLLIDGILEERRSRIEYLINIQSSFNKKRFIDLIGILNSFLFTHNRPQVVQRDLACHILAQLIE
jgi:hypothetical protein